MRRKSLWKAVVPIVMCLSLAAAPGGATSTAASDGRYVALAGSGMVCDAVIGGHGVGGMCTNMPATVVQAQPACTFEDTTWTNTAYQEGPGTLITRGETDGLLQARAEVSGSDQTDVWAKATDRINSPRHTLEPGTWNVRFQFSSFYGELFHNGGNVEGVARFGAQIEHFTGASDVYFFGNSQDVVVAPNQGGFGQGGDFYFVGEFDVVAASEFGGLFFVDAHVVRHASDADIRAYSAMGAVSICWTKVADTSLGQLSREVTSTVPSITGDVERLAPEARA